MDRRPSKRLRVDLKDWSFVRTIGAGLFGRVKLAKHKREETYIAVKVLQKSQIISLKQVDHIYSEYKVLKEVDHPFIVKILNLRQI
jgi:protein kinase X